MIKQVTPYLFDKASCRAAKLVLRYCGGSLPTTNVNLFNLCYFMGFSVADLPANAQGIEMIVHNSPDVGLFIEHIPNIKDLDFALAYAIAIVDMGFLNMGEIHKEYCWGSTLTDAERMVADHYAKELMNYCYSEEFV